MIKIALTGSIGMGKSTVAAMFERAGIPLFDADAEVRRLQGHEGPLLAPIEARFPGVVRDGMLDREALAERVLAGPAALADLEAIIHPSVMVARERFIAQHRDSPILLFDIPLLFETAGESAFDKVIVVSAPEAVERDRVLARPGMTEGRLRSILERQMPDQEKRKRADWVVETGGDFSATEAQVAAIIACLGESDAR
ncbi:MAG: dephospho-CoA kinase [Sphingomicrobium sp.]